MANALHPAAPQDRQIRVFVSSTFRDMKAERDYLVKFIFPQLRKLCESRGVTWGEVDLRWGVTDEEAAEGKVLPICLEEIKRCRPYFIGILGERYGWVPDTIPPELIEQEEWLEEQFTGKKSVTELEILHGVLNNPKMAGHAFFYLRDPDYINHLPPEENRADYVSEDTASAAKLCDLKKRLAGSPFPVREGYKDIESFGKLVLDDLTGVIEKLWPEGSKPDPLDREAMDHEAFAQSRARVYIGRQEYFDRLDAHATGSGDQPLVILGESGSGKSALLANWTLKHCASHPGELVIQHYIGGTPYSSDWAAMLRRIIGEFKRRLGIVQDIPDQPDALRSAFPNWLHMAAAKGRVILILDALNQLEDRDGAPDLVWLPPVMPPNVRLIVSTLPSRVLEEITKRKWPVLKVEPLDEAERRKLITDFLAQSSRRLSPARVERIASTPQSTSPLYLRVLLDELRVFGEHERLDERINHYLQAQTIPELFERVLVRWERDYEGDTDLVGDAMSLLWAARRGLSEAELLDALGKKNEKGEHEPLPRAKWSPLFLAAADSLVSHGGLLTFFHDYLREAVQKSYLSSEEEQKAAHVRLADFFATKDRTSRQVDEFPWQLAEAKEWDRLQVLLVDRSFFVDAGKQEQFEARSYWMLIENCSCLRMVNAYSALIERPELEPDKGYLWLLGCMLDATGHREEALKVRSALVEHFRALGDLNNLQLTLGARALILGGSGDLDGAMAQHKEAERICRYLGNPDGVQRTLHDQAAILKARGNVDQAMELYKEAECICRQLGNLHGLLAILGNQALILSDHGELEEAMILQKETERISRQLGNLDALQNSINNQAVIFTHRGKLDEAMRLYKEAERICREFGNLDGLQRTIGHQALILHECGLGDKAMALLKEQERICRQLAKPDSISNALGNQANVFYTRGDLKKAMILHKEAEQIYRKLGNLDGLQRTLCNEAVILKGRGDLGEAIKLLKEQEQVCRQLGNINGLCISLANQATILKQLGSANEGFTLAEVAYQMATQHGYVALAKQIELILNDLLQNNPTTIPKISQQLADEPKVAYPRESTANVVRQDSGEASETHLQKLLDRGDPLETVAPDLITALLNAHTEPLPTTIARVQKLISELEDYGHFDLALAARRQLEAKVPSLKKPWWKIW